MSRQDLARELFSKIGVEAPFVGLSDGTKWMTGRGEKLVTHDPTTGEALGSLTLATPEDYEHVMTQAMHTFKTWRERPAPLRGQLVRTLGELMRTHKEALGALISLEMGKIRSEGLGEVQEMIDICDFAVGLSRQLHGLTIASERPQHRMMEQWHPLGPIAVITAFNFPMAVWAWNAALAAVCGDVTIWKPSPQTPLCAIALQHLCHLAMKEHDAEGVFALVNGGADIGAMMSDDKRIPLVSFTGSIPIGRKVASQVGARLGRSLLELGGNNAIIVMKDADLDMATRAITFGAVGTAGQRCTTTRRVFVHKDLSAELTQRLVSAYKSVCIGDPLEDGVLMGPLSTEQSVVAYEKAIEEAKKQGGEIVVGAARVDRAGHFVEPTLVKAPAQADFPIAWEETFAPILYIFEIDTIEEAINAQNAVTQGLSSAIFTDSMRDAERFLSAAGSDCGIANVNIGTSGAEIGGAFGGEKDTGGGRESGSDAWKNYMRRQTCTVNWGSDLPLAQGVEFT